MQGAPVAKVKGGAGVLRGRAWHLFQERQDSLERVTISAAGQCSCTCGCASTLA